MSERPLRAASPSCAGATRGAGRGIAVGARRGRCDGVRRPAARHASRRSEVDRPETIEETAELVSGGGRGGDRGRGRPPRSGAGRGPRRPDRRRARPPRRARQRHLGRRAPLRVEDARVGARPRRRPAAPPPGVETHLITSHHALPLLLRDPAASSSRSPTARRSTTPATTASALFYDLAKTSLIRLAWARPGGRAARRDGRRADAGLAALGVDARALRRDGGGLAPRGPSARRTSASPRAHCSSAARSPRSPPIPTSRAGTGSRCRAAGSPRSTASRTPTARARTAGATSSRCGGGAAGRRHRLSLTADRRPPGG